VAIYRFQINIYSKNPEFQLEIPINLLKFVGNCFAASFLVEE